MANLKPIGSEKLTGQEKLNRIMEIARFNEVMPKAINETAKSEYSVSLADGHKYEIVFIQSIFSFFWHVFFWHRHFFCVIFRRIFCQIIF